MPQFVILRHESPQGVHFDFMLEADGVLKTWALPGPPAAGAEMECVQLADHRLAYLDYEGPISGGRGSVTRWDRGTYAPQEQSETQWIVELAGEKFSGRASLRRCGDEPGQWRFAFGEKQDG
jgi:DNA ligase D-like protein (predicted 3'-phosphoesterase)